MIRPTVLRCFAVVLVLCAFERFAFASIGDRLPEFHECVEVGYRMWLRPMLTIPGLQSRELRSWQEPTS